ncbi:MAG: RHS repeat-associated core domain-containing protein [Pseudomonadota bacterium]
MTSFLPQTSMARRQRIRHVLETVLRLRRWRMPLLALTILLGASAAAQVAAPTVPPSFCYNRTGVTSCHPTLDAAEAVMRADTFFQGAQDAFEHTLTEKINVDTARMKYAILRKPAESVGAPAYFGDFGPLGNSQGECSLSEDQIALPGWCSNEEEINRLAQQRINWAHPNCQITQVEAGTTDYDALPNVVPVVDTVRARVDYGAKTWRATLVCGNGDLFWESWQVLKQRPMTCRNGFSAVSGRTTETLLSQDFLCKAAEGDGTFVNISMPVSQCGSCAGSPSPIYPATGEKRRAEPDFEFAGTTFTRHYRSLRQFRNNPEFAVGWTHTWSDRVIAGGSSLVPYAHIDENGDYEGYVLLTGNRYRGENSVDRILERVAANGIGFRLWMADGEVREFNTSGQLIAVRHPEDPTGDIAIAIANGRIASIADAQGRTLRFEYAGRLLQRIVLPDDTAVAYAYDANLNLVSASYPDGATRQYHYNEPGLAGATNQRHHLTGITAENGRRYASFAYDARGRALSSRVHGSPEELTTASYPDEDSATLRTADNGNDAYTVQPGVYRRILASNDGSATARNEYDGQGRLLRTTDKRGAITEYAYANGYRSAIVEAVGTEAQRRQEVDRDPASGRVTETRVRDRNGALVARTTWSYNARRQPTLVTAIDPTTGETRTLTNIYCEPGDTDCPLTGLLKSIDGPLAGTSDTTRFEYRMADAPGCATSPVGCAYRRGDLWKAINALGHAREILAYDGSGRPVSMRDANGVTTDLTYDARGRLAVGKIRGADDGAEYDDQIVRIEYAPTGTVRRIVLADGVETRFFHDDAMRLTRIVDGAGNALQFALGPAGQILREDTRDVDGVLLRTLSRTYDTLGRLQAVTDADLRSTTFVHDAGGLPTLATDPLGRKTSRTHDALGRLRVALQDVDGIAARTELQYDALDRVVRATDPNGLHTDSVYNAFGDLLSQSSPDAGATVSSYDPAGRLRTLTDARGIVVAFAYDALDRPVSVSYPDSSRNQGFVYDTAPGECPAGERFHIGRLARMTDASGATAYCYDRFGHLTRKLQTTLGRTLAVRYDHAPRAGDGNAVLLRPRPAAGHLMALTYPDGAQVRIERNQLRQATGLTVVLANGQTRTLLRNAAYYPFGPVGQWTYGNGRQLRRSLDRNYRPGFVEDTRPGGISEGYWYDAAGRLESLRRADQRDPARRRYEYDGLDRLTVVRDGASNALLQSYAYDKTGNRIAETDGGTSRSYAYVAGSHRLASVGGVARQYDAAGNTTRIGGGVAAAALPMQTAAPRTATIRADSRRAQLQTQARARREAKRTPSRGLPLPSRGVVEAPAGAANRTATTALNANTVRDFLYDDTGRLRQVRHDGAVAMDYLHNANGERVYRTGGGQTVLTVYDEAGHWLGDYDGNGQPLQQAIWLDDLPVSLLVGAGAQQRLYYLEPDALGSPRVAIDPDRDVAVWTWDLAGEAFGEGAPHQDPDGDGIAFVLDLRYPGQRYDAATGLNDNYQRDYDPTTGRYLQSDPIGLAGGVSTYGYVEGDPLGGIDPWGLRRSSGAGDILKGVLTRLGGPKAIQQAAGLLARKAARKKELLEKQMAAIRARFARGQRAKGMAEAPGCENVAVRSADWFESTARQATRNPGSDRVVLGHFSRQGTSYQKVAAHYGASYFKVDDWNAVTKGLEPDEIWRINESFLDQQILQGKKILFSHDPLMARATSFFEREVNYLRDLGYEFRRRNQWTWEAVR